MVSRRLPLAVALCTIGSAPDLWSLGCHHRSRKRTVRKYPCCNRRMQRHSFFTGRGLFFWTGYSEMIYTFFVVAVRSSYFVLLKNPPDSRNAGITQKEARQLLHFKPLPAPPGDMDNEFFKLRLYGSRDRNCQLAGGLLPEREAFLRNGLHQPFPLHRHYPGTPLAGSLFVDRLGHMRSVLLHL